MRAWVLLTVIAFANAAIGADFPVLDAERQAVIVRAATARDEAVTACTDLARLLKRATGREFAILAEGEFRARPNAYPIYVGRCAALPAEDKAALGELDRDAFLVHITERAAFLAGPRPWSTYWAACQFLEDYVGVRWLIPGPLGEDVLPQERITAPCARRILRPAILSRLWSGAGYGGIWSLRQRIHARYRFHHNLLNVFDASKHFDAHPEWFPLRNGKRYRPSGGDDHSWQPCLAAQSSVQHAADTARAAWSADADLESYSYGCNDGQGWCECDRCKAMDQDIEPWDGFEGTYSARYYGWLNRVAEELETTDPKKMLGCLAYSTYILPPEQLGLHRNIIPYLTSNRADYWEPSFRAKDEELLEWWGRVANQMGIYDYAYGMGFAIPRIYNHLFLEALQHAVRNGVRGFYAEVYPNWGLDGHKLYVMSRLLWNPWLDVDAVTEEWNARMFCEAAEPMSRYFARCERAWREQKTGRGHWAYRLAADPKQFQIFPPHVLRECTQYLDKAARVAERQTVKDRIRFFRKTWEVTLLLAGNFWAARDVQTLLDRGASLDRVAQALRKMAEKSSAQDIDAYMAERVGDDPIAFHPPKQSWITPLKTGAATNAMRWSASRISQAVVREARQATRLDADDLRARIDERIRGCFGAEGTAPYQKYVADIRAMARKVVAVKKCAAAPRIDGLLTDQAWRAADTMVDFAKWGDSALSRLKTVGRLVHDGRDLYLALECYQDTSTLKVDAAPRDGSTWKDDSVEIFLNPGLSEFPYVQFIVNAKGAFFDQWGKHADQTYSERLEANFGCAFATVVEKDRWTAEIRLPLAEFGCAPTPDSLLRLNLVRNVQGKNAEISAWFSSIHAHADPLSRGWVLFGQ